MCRVSGHGGCSAGRRRVWARFTRWAGVCRHLRRACIDAVSRLDSPCRHGRPSPGRMSAGRDEALVQWRSRSPNSHARSPVARAPRPLRGASRCLTCRGGVHQAVAPPGGRAGSTALCVAGAALGVYGQSAYPGPSVVRGCLQWPVVAHGMQSRVMTSRCWPTADTRGPCRPCGSRASISSSPRVAVGAGRAATWPSSSQLTVVLGAAPATSSWFRSSRTTPTRQSGSIWPSMEWCKPAEG